MTGREDDAGRTVRSLLLEETNAMPIDTHHAAVHLQRRLADTRRRRTLAVAASVVAIAVITLVGGWLGINKAGDPAQNPDQAEAVAREFLAAFGSFDADTAITYLTNDAIVEGWGTPELLRLDFAWFRAQGFKQTITDCEQQGNSESGVRIQCDFDMHSIRSDEIGLGPYTDNYWAFIVREGKIVSARQEIVFGSNRFLEQMHKPFAAWVSIEHPDDVLAMFEDKPVTEETNRLWEQRTAEYVADVKQNPAASLDQPKVAAYVAELDSICAAAQARVKDEIQAIPHTNQQAVIDARDRIMRETIRQLRAAQLPKAVRWPYEGRAFPLMDKFYTYPQNVQPPETLARQIQAIPGLDKCIFSA
jgi:hypothetical protein